MTVHSRQTDNKAAKAFLAALSIHRAVFGRDPIDTERGLELLACVRKYQSRAEFQSLVEALPDGVLKGCTAGAAKLHALGVRAGCLDRAADAHRRISDEHHSMLTPKAATDARKGRDRCSDYRKRLVILLLCMMNEYG